MNILVHCLLRFTSFVIKMYLKYLIQQYWILDYLLVQKCPIGGFYGALKIVKTVVELFLNLVYRYLFFKVGSSCTEKTSYKKVIPLHTPPKLEKSIQKKFSKQQYNFTIIVSPQKHIPTYRSTYEPFHEHEKRIKRLLCLVLFVWMFCLSKKEWCANFWQLTR